MRLCYLLAYRSPDYIRTRTLLQALASLPGVELRVVRNKHPGLRRYSETLMEAAHVERTWRPDFYLVGFRGHEIYPLLRTFIPGGKLLFDNMMSPTLSLLEERGFGLARRLVLTSTIGRLERWILQDARVVLTDTDAHIGAFKKHFGLGKQTLLSVPVAADETFLRQTTRKTNDRVVLFYGSFLPLHGTSVILEALKRIRIRGVTFHFVGGTDADGLEIEKLREDIPGIQIRHDRFIPFDKLIRTHLAQAWLCLGGPFGGTPQAMRVVTGKTAQSLAMGIPTILGDNPASDGLVDQRNCLKVPQKDPEALARALEWAFRHPDELERIGKAGKAYYDKHLSIDVVKERIGSLLRQLQ